VWQVAFIFGHTKTNDTRASRELASCNVTLTCLIFITQTKSAAAAFGRLLPAANRCTVFLLPLIFSIGQSQKLLSCKKVECADKKHVASIGWSKK
jgi:hypothetical protein